MSLVSEDTPQKSDPQLGGMTLDQKLACILDEIEREKTPDRLLKLASELQALLLERGQLLAATDAQDAVRCP